MKLLGIDTSTKYLGVALVEGEKTLAAFRDKGGLNHSTLLVPAIDEVLGKSALKLKDLDAIAISIGPGSFTGLRIGVAAVKAINLATGVRLVAVPTLDVIAYNFVSEKERVLCPVIDAKKGKIYACFYEGRRRLTDYMLTDIEEVLKMINKPTFIFGDVDKYAVDNWYPRAEVVAKLGLEKARRKEFAEADKLAPMYMHSMYCQVKNA